VSKLRCHSDAFRTDTFPRKKDVRRRSLLTHNI